jgi:site-specific recombinase XerC
MLKGGGDLAAVSKLLGHAKINQTQEAYYELLKGAKEEAVSLLPKIEVKEKPKKEVKTGRKKSREPEQSVSEQVEQPADVPPGSEISPAQESVKVVSMDGFKKRMLVKAVGQ